MEELTRKQKKSHDHRFTTWLKNIIFGIVMIAPFLSVMARTIYVQSNPNAMESYYGETINEKQLILLTNINQFYPDKTYSFNSSTYDVKDTQYPQSAYALRIYFKNIKNIVTTIPNFDTTRNFLGLYINVNGQLSTTNNNNIYNLSTNPLSFEFDYISNDFNYNFAYNDLFYEVTYNKYSFLDNAFDYSINQLHNVNVYNWSKNTAIYTAIDDMTSGLGMGENNTLALLLAYWSILTAVYIVFDIIIFCFTKITHFINSD